MPQKLISRLTVAYVFLLIGIAPFGKEYLPWLHKFILWGLGPAMVVLLLLPRADKLSTMLPKELWRYFFLLLFAIAGSFKVIYWNDFFRYVQVILSNFLLMSILYVGLYRQKDLVNLFWCLQLSLITIVAFSYFIEGGQSFSNDSFERLSGLVGNSNGTATYARTALLFSLLLLERPGQRTNVWKRIYLLSGVLFASYIIILTASRANFAILCFILMSYLYIKYFYGKKLILLAFIVMLFGSIIWTVLIGFIGDYYLYERLTKNESFENIDESEVRIQLYLKAFEVTKENPIFGVGLNQFRHYSDGHISHTDILDISSQLGIIAALVYLSIYIKLFRRISKVMKMTTPQSPHRTEVFLVMVFLVAEFLFGLSNPNWFLQLNMVVLVVLILYTMIKERCLHGLYYQERRLVNL